MTSEPRNKRLDIEPYLFIYDTALRDGGITAQQAATALGCSRAAAHKRIYRLVYTGALIERAGRPILYLPGEARGCKRVIELAIEKSIRTVDRLAQTSQPGKGAQNENYALCRGSSPGSNGNCERPRATLRED